MSKDLANTFQTLAAEAMRISQLLLESNGELSPELEERLLVNEALLTKKVDAYNFVIQEFEAQEELWKRRKDACAQQQKKFANEIERLKLRIKETMTALSTTEVRGSHFKFQLRRSTPKLVIENEQAIPNDFKVIVQTTSVDTKKVKAALAEGFSVPGAKLEESTALFPLSNSKE